jgi:hypothetical protein
MIVDNSPSRRIIHFTQGRAYNPAMRREASFKEYFVLFRKQLNQDAAAWARDNIGWGLVMALAPPIAAFLLHRTAIDWPLFLTTIWIYIAALFVYLLIHTIRAPWKLHRQLTTELSETKTALEKKTAELEELVRQHTNNAPVSFPARVGQLAHELLSFLREKGTQPVTEIDPSASIEDQLRAIGTVCGPWVNGIAFGYDRKYKPRVLDLIGEAREHGIDPGVADYEIEPPHGQNVAGIRAVAEKLFALRTALEMREHDDSIKAPIVPPVSSDKWQELASQFGKLSNYTRADWQCERLNNATTYHAWRFAGGSETQHCETLCRYAGTLLLKSPNVSPTVSANAREQTDAAWRWLYFLKENHRASRGSGHPPIGGDGTIYLLESISEVASVSMRVCTECAALEL